MVTHTDQQNTTVGEFTLSADIASAMIHKQTALLDEDILITHTRFYQWNDEAMVFECTHAGLQVTHQMGMCWDTWRQRFVACKCVECI